MPPKENKSTHFSKCIILKSIRHSEKGEKLTGLCGTVERATGHSNYFKWNEPLTTITVLKYVPYEKTLKSTY